MAVSLRRAQGSVLVLSSRVEMVQGVFLALDLEEGHHLQLAQQA